MLPPRRLVRLAAASAACCVLVCTAARADRVADFYAGAQIRLVTGGTAGGGYDLYLRLLSEFFGRHVPGNPHVVVENRTGAGGINAVNYVYNAAPKDGTNLIMPYNIHPTFELLRPKGVKFDSRRLQWLGNLAELNDVMAVIDTAGVRTIADAKRKEIILGASSKGSETYIIPVLFNKIVGTKFKLVTGYAGTSPITLAMERGEIQGRVGSYYIWVASKPDWLRDGKLVLLAQDGLARNPALPDVPLYEDLVSSPEDKAIMRFMSYPVATSRALAVAPGVPADRVAALRTALMATLADPDFLATAKKRHMDIAAKDHKYVERVIAEMYATPPALIARMKTIFDWK
jgi:tripartite-type tricarboxylate transporter receptor subunit TctC